MKFIHSEFRSWLNHNIVWPIGDWTGRKIALILYYLGKKPGSTSFIDGSSVSYGYGKMRGTIGIWQYQLPFGFVEKRRKIISKR